MRMVAACTLVDLLSAVDLGNLFLNELVALLADGDNLLAGDTELGNLGEDLLGDLGGGLVLGEGVGVVERVIYDQRLAGGVLSDVGPSELDLVSRTTRACRMDGCPRMVCVRVLCSRPQPRGSSSSELWDRDMRIEVGGGEKAPTDLLLFGRHFEVVIYKKTGRGKGQLKGIEAGF